MTVTWTSGYGINDAEPFVEWGPKGADRVHSPAGTLTFTRDSLCGKPSLTFELIELTVEISPVMNYSRRPNSCQTCF
jgi:hypothetical protein